MKQFLLVSIFFGILATLAGPSPASAQGASVLSSITRGEAAFAGEDICLPGAYLLPQEDCLAVGPSKTLTELAKKGLTVPLRPMPAASPDPELTKHPLNFAKVDVPFPEQAPVYSSLDSAIRGQNPVGSLPASPMLYVSYVRRSDVEGKKYVQTPSGHWLRASPAGYSLFQGLEFQRNPPNSFGWIVDAAEVRIAPGYRAARLKLTLPRNTQVQIFDKVKQDGVDWYLINLNQWVERRYIRQVTLNYNPPAGVDNQRWIEVNLYEQTLSVYENGRLIFATLIASGLKPFYTQPGLFKIYKKKATERMTGSFEADRSDFYYLEDVPWTMYFDEARALHGAYWRAMFGYAQSHGCVNLSMGDSHWLYNWAKEGDWVYVWDPSGATPTDPKYYTPGGA
jgi:lipoprotein-anchoring transpeptidase ErfK/SrfK